MPFVRGQANDSSGSGNSADFLGFNDPTSIHTSDLAPGAIGQSILTDGTGERVSAGDVDALDVGAGELSVSGWYKGTDASAALAVKDNWAGSGNGIFAFINAGRLAWWNGSITLTAVAGTGTINDGAWHHWVVTLDSSNNIKMYVDKVDVTSGTPSDTRTFSNALAFVIASTADNNVSARLVGRSDDVRVYGKALSSAEVTYLFEEHTGGDLTLGTDPTDTDLLIQYKFNDKNTIADGDPCYAWQSKEGNDFVWTIEDTARRPTLRIQNGINNVTSLEFDGLFDYLKLGSAPFAAHTQGTLSITFKTGSTAPSGDMVLVASSDEATAVNYWEIGIDSNWYLYIEWNNGSAERITGTTKLTAKTVYNVVAFSDGSSSGAQLNGASYTMSGTNNGNWWGDVTGADNMTLGAREDSGGAHSFFEGLLGEVVFYDSNLSGTHKGNLATYSAQRYNHADA